MSPIDKARALYERDGKDFDRVFAEHVREGIIFASPLWFMMLRATEVEGQAAWFIECAVGDLKALAQLVRVHLPLLAFCRVKNGTKTFKVYHTERLLRLALREVTIP